LPRWKKRRCCQLFEGQTVFKPLGVPAHELPVIELEQDELEALRLCDRENLTQEEAGRLIGVSRGTVQRLLESGRAKLVEFLLAGSALHVVPPSNHPYPPVEARMPEADGGFSRGRGRRRRRGGGHHGF
jgi:predicted DNA-binding protein (UPF0251 family)